MEEAGIGKEDPEIKLKRAIPTKFMKALNDDDEIPDFAIDVKKSSNIKEDPAIVPNSCNGLGFVEE